MKPRGGKPTTLPRMKTGIENLDQIFGGGLPEFSTNIIAGPPGSGKTILAQQIGFEQARNGKKVLYISTVSEPTIKIIRYQSQFSFFDQSLVEKTFFYRAVADVFKNGGFAKGAPAIAALIEEIEPDFVFIDSFKAIADLAIGRDDFRLFVYELLTTVSSHEVTTFLVGEYGIDEISVRPEFAIVDGIFHVSLAAEKDQPRYLEIRKLRGSKYLRGHHPFEITKDGIRCYPHPEPSAVERQAKLAGKISTHIPGLDAMSSGGFYEGSTSIVAGSAGTGKTSLAVKFLGKDGLLVSFEEKPGRIERYAENMQLPIPHVLYISPMQFIPERASELVKEAVRKTNVRRIVIDGISDVHMGDDVLYDLLDFLAQHGLTTVLIFEIRDPFGASAVTPSGASRLVDNVLLLRYVELNGKIERTITLLKMRGSPHDRAIRRFEIAPGEGIRIGEQLAGYSGLMTGIAQPTSRVAGEELAKGFRF